MTEKDFNTLFSSLSDKLFRLAKSILKNTDEAVDAVQELQLKLWEKRESLSEAENKNTYTLRTLRNLCIDTLRRQHVHEEISESWEHIPAAESYSFESTDMANYVSRLIDRLPELQRTIIRMRDVEEMEVTEIATVTGLTENAVNVNLSRARKKLREKLLNES